MGLMRPRRLPAILIALAGVCLLSPRLLARELTFDDRVRAQEAIERAYLSHQIGNMRSFEEAVPRSLLEKKVRTYLKQSAALEQHWKTPITAAMLRAEVARMQRQSRMPERLKELFASLNNDPLLIEECLARPALAARLVGNFFAFDERIHGKVRGQAEAAAHHDSTAQKKWIVVEERDGFVLRDAGVRPDASNPSDRPMPARHFPKTPLETWWSEVEGTLSIDAIHPVGEDGTADIRPLPEPSLIDCSTDNTWDNGSLDDMPYGRSSPVAVWTGSHMIVWGGTVGTYSWNVVNTGGRYDPATDTWLPTSLQNAPPSSEPQYRTAIWTGSEMIIWGNDSYPYNGGWRYNPLTDTWTPTSLDGAPNAGIGFTAIWTGSRMVIWGGDFSSLLNTGGRYDPSTDTWQPTSTSNAPSPRYYHSAVWTGAEMIVWGGGGGGGTGGRYNPSTDTWGAVSTVNAPPVGQAVWTGTSMLVLSPDATTSGRRYDPASNVWTPMSRSGAPELSRSNATVVWAGSEMILWGGHPSAGGGDLNTGGRYNPSTDSWTLTSTLNAPSARSRHVAVWTGSRMVIWGGYIASAYLDVASGGRYDPASDSWTPTSESSAPSPRISHKAVWTGNSMIVWGGLNEDLLYENTGGRYDPVFDSWTPTSTAAAPAGRSGFTALWTGNAMIVWGGGAGSTTYFNDGALYDPIPDQWTPTSFAGAPSARSGHTGVWTGTRVIVWGGTDGTVRLNTGGIYDPLANGWSPTSLAGAPSVRAGHRAVWTGDRMIVWGGYSGASVNLLNTGGRYNPVNGEWTPTSTANAPFGAGGTALWTGSLMLVWGTTYNNNDGTGRYDPLQDQWTSYSPVPGQISAYGHSAVWTGSRMIIWGGGTPGDFFLPIYNTGAIYDPVGDSWTLTSTQNAPSEHYGPTAVWTGTSMIVWGGYGPGDTSPLLNTGGIFRSGLSTDDDGDSYSECGNDCDDANPGVHPGAAEICNGLDDDCSAVADDGGGALCDDLDGCTSDACAGAAGCAHPIRDVDVDGHPDAACGGNDCNDLNPSEWSPPAVVTGLVLTSPGPANPSWTSQAGAAGPGTSYDLVSGMLGPSAGVSFSTASCLQSATATSYSDSRSGPTSGFAYWYLARARNSCATASYGSPGRDSGIPACP